MTGKNGQDRESGNGMKGMMECRELGCECEESVKECGKSGWECMQGMQGIRMTMMRMWGIRVEMRGINRNRKKTK